MSRGLDGSNKPPSDLADLAQLDLGALRRRWTAKLGTPFPEKLKGPALFRMMLGYKLREQVEGPLSQTARRKLQEIEAKHASGKTAAALVRLPKGAVLKREWNGQTHEVHVLPEGYLYEGRAYRSLSHIARLITGVRWNGPRFFGFRSQRNG